MSTLEGFSTYGKHPKICSRDFFHYKTSITPHQDPLWVCLGNQDPEREGERGRAGGGERAKDRGRERTCWRSSSRHDASRSEDAESIPSRCSVTCSSVYGLRFGMSLYKM